MRNANDSTKKQPLYRYSDANTYTDNLTLAEAQEFQRLQNGGTITPMPIKPVKVIAIDSTECRTWFERDRQHVNLVNKLTDQTIVEWWDESVSEAVEDGFLNPRDYHQSAYEYAKYLGILPAAPKHYIAMSGSHGYLPDNCDVYETRQAAIDSLVSLFDLGRTRAARLKKNGYLELIASPIEQAQDVSFGAEYCEVTECDCDNPAVHSDSL